MLDEIIASLPFKVRETRFLKPPDSTYGVYQIDRQFRGCDRHIGICNDDITFYIVEFSPDDQAERLFEAELIRRGVEFEKQARSWLESEKIYEVIYNFTIIKKLEVKHHGSN